MKIIQKEVTYKELEIDLMAIPATEWPKKVKDIARDILGKRHKEFLAIPKDQRKAWLVSKVEDVSAMTNDFDLWINNNF